MGCLIESETASAGDRVASCTKSPKSTNVGIKSENEELIPAVSITSTTPSQLRQASELKSQVTDSMEMEMKMSQIRQLKVKLNPNLPDLPIQIQYSKSEYITKSKYFVQFVKKENDKNETEFVIQSMEQYVTFKKNNPQNNNNNKDDNIEWPLDYYWDNAPESTKFYWSIFMAKKGIHQRCPGYFKILDLEKDDDNKSNDNYTPCTQTKISSEDLKVFLYFLHHPKIRKYLDIKNRECWDKYNIKININQQQYALKYWNGKDINQCQTLVILKPKSHNTYKTIYALYFPEPNKAIEWRWYDPDHQKYSPYQHNTLQILEFEASYYANIQTNFPICNKLFRSELNTFDCCYLHKFSQIMAQKYCMRYTLDRKNDGTYDIIMDQIRLETARFGYPRTVKRHFDRQKYLETMVGFTVNKALTQNVTAICPMITATETNPENKTKIINTYEQKIKWIALFDNTPSEANKYNLTITSDFNEEKSTQYSSKTIQVKPGMNAMKVKTINIKEPELVTSRCKQFMWAKFKRNKSRQTRLCQFANGFWDISFDSDEKYTQLRTHLDAILSIIQHSDVQQHFGLKINKTLHITIDEQYEYDLLWYNNLQTVKKTQAVRIKQKKKQSDNTYKMSTMFIMYFPKPAIKTFSIWQWYDNNKCQYIHYKDENELLQLECSYLSNLYENYPKDIVGNYFTHCLFSTFMLNHKTSMDKLYVLRYSIIEELENKVIVEQVAYSENNNFPRPIRKIRLDELEKEEKNQYVPRIDIEYDNNNNAYPVTPTLNYTQTPCQPPTLAIIMDERTVLHDVVQRFTQILTAYQRWICKSNIYDKTPGMLAKLAEIYGMQKEPRNAIIKLQNDFKLLLKEIDKTEDSSGEMTRISDEINLKLGDEFRHCSDNCICAKRAHRDRKVDDSKEKYFGFDDRMEIITQQKLDSYHCHLLHLYDIKNAESDNLNINFIFATTESEYEEYKYDKYELYDDDDEKEESKSNNKSPLMFIPIPSNSYSRSRGRTSSLIKYNAGNKNKKNKFTTYTAYDTGYRFYYWDYYKCNTNKVVEYQDIIADPGNTKPDGAYYTFEEWHIEAAYKDLKEEILSFGDKFGYNISKNQFDAECKKADIHLESAEGRDLKCTESNWEDKYGLIKGSSITRNHLLAIQLYCSFTDAVELFTQTFRKKDAAETDRELKERHKYCALWGKYLRECVEGFGLKLKKGRGGIPSIYFRGITKKFIFKKTILNFNLVFSTTVKEEIAEYYAGSKDGNGLVLTLKPHWGDYPGNIRAWDCSGFSDYPWEGEYLFIGGLEPLVIHNIRETKIGGKNYQCQIQAINNIYQIFQGMACKFNMKKKLIKKLIENRLKCKKDDKRNNDYISQIFDCYCEDLVQIKIRLSLMDKSYQKIRDNFMDNTNILKLDSMIKLFPKCQRITLFDGFDYQLIPKNAEYIDTIFGVIEKCIKYVNIKMHPLKEISLETNEQIDSTFFGICQQQLKINGWRCGDKNKEEFRYKICRL